MSLKKVQLANETSHFSHLDVLYAWNCWVLIQYVGRAPVNNVKVFVVLCIYQNKPSLGQAVYMANSRVTLGRKCCWLLSCLFVACFIENNFCDTPTQAININLAMAWISLIACWTLASNTCLA